MSKFNKEKLIKFFNDSVLFRLISFIVYGTTFLVLYFFFSVEVSLMLTVLFSIIELHGDLIDRNE